MGKIYYIIFKVECKRALRKIEEQNQDWVSNKENIPPNEQKRGYSNLLEKIKNEDNPNYGKDNVKKIMFDFFSLNIMMFLKKLITQIV